MSDPIGDLIQSIIQQSESFDRDQVVEQVIRTARKTMPLVWENYTAASDHKLVAAHLRKILHNNRRTIKRRKALSVTEAKAKEAKAAKAGNRKRRVVAHYEAGGAYVKLRSMTKTQLLDTARHMEASAVGLQIQAKLIRKVARRLTAPDAVAGDFWTNEQLDAMFSGSDPLSDAA